MAGNSSPVISSQTEVSIQLESVVNKHLKTEYKKPFHQFSHAIFDQLNDHISKSSLPIILDSGCGTGDSSFHLSALHPNHLIIGIDKSKHRLKKHLKEKTVLKKDNVMLIQGDIVDLWRLIKQTEWKIEKHYLLYPNPWPKPEQLKRRWHGHPIFPTLLSLCHNIELRTNWKVYAEEFKQACEIATNKKNLMQKLELNDHISPFEKKYQNSGHELYQVLIS